MVDGFLQGNARNMELTRPRHSLGLRPCDGYSLATNEARGGAKSHIATGAMWPRFRADPVGGSLIDHHCHGVVRADLDRQTFEQLITKSDFLAQKGQPIETGPWVLQFDGGASRS